MPRRFLRPMVVLALAALLLAAVAAGVAAAPLPLPHRSAQALPALLLLASGAYAMAPSFPCDRPVDLIFVTDESSSISDEQWPKLLRFIVELSTAFPSATGSLTGGVALGFVGFSGDLTPNQIALRSELNNTVFSERVSGFDQTGGGTRTYKAIKEAQQQLLAGRSPLLGVSRLIIVLTDGDTNGGNDGTDLTIAAADAARGAGITVAAVAIGELVNVENSRAEREMFGIANNSDLVFFIKDWAGLDNDTVVLSALANIACQAPVAPPEVNVTITTAVACNTSIFISWDGTQRNQAFLGSPVSLRGSVEGGLMRICWSYKDEAPLPALPPAVTPATTQCTEALPGAAAISTTAAFPPGRDPRSEASNLYVSLTALNTTNATDGTWSCGGRANITAAFCHARLASVLPALPGPGAGGARPDVVVTDLGNPGESTCSACPPGGHLLFPFDAGVALAGVCSTGNCTGGSQYLSSPLLESRRPGFQPNASGFTVCRDCHPSCSSAGSGAGAAAGGSCVAPPEFLLDAARGALLPPPTPSSLLCSACSGGSLLNSSADPALVSPSWTAMLALLAVSQPPTPAYPSPFFLPPPALLSGSPSLPGQSGRCLLAGPAPTQCGSACTSANTGVCLPCPANRQANSADGECEGVVGAPPPAPAPRAAVNVATPVCPANTPATLAERSTTLLVSLCIPRPPAQRPAPNEPLAPSTLAPNCGAFLGTPAAAATLTQLAAVLAVPPATLFLRSCLDTAPTNPNAAPPVLSGRRYMWGWGAQGTTTPNVLEVAGARGALQNATRRANSNCSCDAVATYALVLGAAEPGQWSLSAPGVTGAESTPPLPALTLSKTLMYQRAMTALRILASSPLNTSGGVGPSDGLPLEPWVPPSARVAGGAALPASPRRRLFEPTGGFSPLICAPDSIQLLDACFDDSASEKGGLKAGSNDLGIGQETIVSGLGADKVWTLDMLNKKNMLTMCGPPPPPEVFPPSPPAANPLTPIIEAAAISGGVLFLLILLSILLVLWAGALKQRRLALLDHKARVQRWQRRMEAEARGDYALGPEDASSSLQWEDGILDADTRATKAVFAPTGSMGALGSGAGASSVSRGTISAGMASAVAVSAVGAAGSGGVQEWAAARKGGAGGGGGEQVVTSSNPLAALPGGASASSRNAGGSGSSLGAPAPAPAPSLRSRLLVVEDEWAGVPYHSLSPGKKLVEWLLPGAYTLGMGFGRETVPPSHDITHALGPKRARGVGAAAAAAPPAPAEFSVQ